MSKMIPLTEAEKYLVAILTEPSGSELAEFMFQDVMQDPREYPYGRYRLWPMQWPYYHDDSKHQVDASGRGIGKACDVTLQVPTPNGWTTMGALKEGDYVFDEAGKPTLVTKAYQVMYGRPCFEVEFSDGTKIVSDESHLWETWDHAARRGNRGDLVSLRERIDRYQRIVQMRSEGLRWKDIASIEGFADPTGPANLVKRGDPARLVFKPEVRTTAQIRDSLMYNNKEHNHSIPTCAPIVMPERDLLIDPYVLGAWLGDGTSRLPEITTGDSWVLEEFERRGLCVTKLKAPYRWSFRLSDGSFTPLLRKEGLLQNKNIPGDYLRASIKQRKDLLAGLMDCDGHIREDGRCEITQKSRRLIDGVYELLCSLGQKPVITSKMSRIDGVDKGIVYTITWRPTFDPFLLPRKSERFIPVGTQSQRSSHRYIVAVRPVESRPVRCIEVDSPNRLFLVSEAFIATHNSVSAVLRAVAFPFAHQGKEMLVTAPELSHLKLVTDKIEAFLMDYKILRILLPNEGRNKRMNGITNSPHFQVDFTNGTKIQSRLPNRDGRGVKGVHPLVIEQDEIQDYPEKGYTELIETIRIAEPGAMWRIHGVSNGVGDLHYRLTENQDPDMPFKVHRYIASHRPTWNDEERKAKIVQYGGSEDHPDYVRNIFGKPGSANSPVFVLRRLMDCVVKSGTPEGLRYNKSIYQHLTLNDEARIKQLNEQGLEIEDLVDIPLSHLDEKYSSYWAGMDVGFTNDPSELLVFGTCIEGDRVVDRLLLRLTLVRLTAPIQKRVISHVFNMYGERLQRFGMDKTGNGLPIYQDLMDEPYSDRIAGYGFAEKRIVEFEDREMLPGEKQEDLGIKKHVVDFATDELRKFVDEKSMELPFDQELLKDWQMQNMAKRGAGESQARKYWGGPEHSLDAARMYAAAKSLLPIEKMLEKPKQQPVLALFGF